MMPGLPELLVVLVIILVLFGAGRLPEVFEAFGKGIKRFREAQNEEDEILADVTPKPEPKKIDAAPAAEAAGAEEAQEVEDKAS